MPAAWLRMAYAVRREAAGQTVGAACQCVLRVAFSLWRRSVHVTREHARTQSGAPASPARDTSTSTWYTWVTNPTKRDVTSRGTRFLENGFDYLR